MEASKLTISEETRAKNKLTPKQRGELRYAKLVEWSKSGELKFINSRKDLAKAVGYQPGDRKGVCWVNNLIQRGNIEEIILGVEDGKVIKEFRLTNKVPNYAMPENRKEKVPSHQPTTMKERETVKLNPLPSPYEVKSLHSLTITKGEITVSANLDSDSIIKVIENIFK